MRKADDLTGRRFGKLLVIERAAPELTKTNKKVVSWRCRCDCGRERTVRAEYLKNGRAVYCGECTSPEWLSIGNRICRYCEFSEMNSDHTDWICHKGNDVSVVKNNCSDYWCGKMDKYSNVPNKEGRCLVCGKPIYSHGSEVPIYCLEHRAHLKKDDEVFEKMPRELLFSLIAGIFLRAREDYVTNADNQGSDAEVFLRSEWAQQLSLSSFDADAVIEQMDKEINEAGRIQKHNHATL